MTTAALGSMTVHCMGCMATLDVATQGYTYCARGTRHHVVPPRYESA